MSMFDGFGSGGRRGSLRSKIAGLHWGLILLLIAIAGVGFASQYSVADGKLEPFAAQQMMRFGMALTVLIGVAVIDIRIWLKIAYPTYGVALLLLILVPLIGESIKGSQRWLDLGVFALQPSELMKITLVLALARYFHGLPLNRVSHPLYMLVPLALIALPAALVLMQPDLGTTALLVAGGAVLFFVAGIKKRYIIGVAAAVLAAIPVGWQFLHPYQRQRVLTFLNPESDTLGSGWHIMQSKIALGSGGVYGKGFLGGTQSHLNFLPEKQTDFIFTVWAEEFGLLGAGSLLFLYLSVLAVVMAIAFQSRNHFGRLLATGIGVTFFLFVFINVAMVMGMVPVVGVPLPFVSYGGTSMMALMFGLGLVQSVYIHRNAELPRSSAALW
jgi:rod shape determining protein RodA